jgi:hypothetical protein
MADSYLASRIRLDTCAATAATTRPADTSQIDMRVPNPGDLSKAAGMMDIHTAVVPGQ